MQQRRGDLQLAEQTLLELLGRDSGEVVEELLDGEALVEGVPHMET